MHKKAVLLLTLTVVFVAITIFGAVNLNDTMIQINQAAQTDPATPLLVCNTTMNGGLCGTPPISWTDVLLFVAPLIISLGLITKDIKTFRRRPPAQK